MMSSLVAGKMMVAWTDSSETGTSVLIARARVSEG